MKTGLPDENQGLAAVCVRRPILSLVLNLIIIIAGLAALLGVEIRELPKVDQPVISVRAEYQGASPATVDAAVTRVLEDSLSALEDLKTMSATSSYGRSVLTLELNPNADIGLAASEARELVASAARFLPDDIDDPIVTKNDADADPVVRLVLGGTASLEDLTEWADGPITDRLTAIPGVASVEIFGEWTPVMRVSFSQLRLTSRGLTLPDLRDALASANLDIPLGALETDAQALIVRSVASAVTAEAIAAIRLNRNTVVGDVAHVQLSAEEPTSINRVNGQPGVGLGVIKQSVGNTLSISNEVRAAVDELREILPDDMVLTVTSDDGIFIAGSIEGVFVSILLAVAIVVFVIFLFLRSLRAVAVPAVAVPVALIGTIAAIWITGFSINTITLLALVLATGMVVDDAIVVLENIVRRRQEGLGAFAAAVVGTREVFFAVISTTATLAAVFVPISFLPGQAGSIFGEFGFVLAFAVALSSFVALTLCPTLCALLDPGGNRAGASTSGPEDEAQDDHAPSPIDRAIAWVLDKRLALVAASAVFAVAALALYGALPQELTPPEDRGVILVAARTPISANLDYTSAQAAKIEQAVEPLIERGEVTLVQSIIGRGGTNTAFVIIRLAAWDERSRNQAQIAAEIRAAISQIPGALIALRAPNSLGIRGAGRGLQFALVGADYATLDSLASELVASMNEDPAFTDAQLSVETDQPLLELEIDRALAANLGVAPRDVIETLNTMIDGDTVTEIFLDDEAVDVLLDTIGRRISDQSDLENTFVAAADGRFVPVASIATLTETAGAATLAREGRQQAVVAQANLGEGVDLGGAAARLAQIAPDVLGNEARVILLGEAATLEEGETGTLLVFAAAILVVFLVLSAQFESFASALIIIITVPFGLGAALLAIWLTGGSLNYYSQIGLVILVGIMAKNGILIVEFANQLREAGQGVDQAIRTAMRLRLRPVMMTMLSTVCGGIPLVIGWGAGAEAREAVGWVVVGGLGFATLFTLCLTPALYRIIAPLSPPTGSATRRLIQELSG
ncbi:MAG: efflux RND transporter permease subunit [Pseudomonadota bacterium]